MKLSGQNFLFGRGGTIMSPQLGVKAWISSRRASSGYHCAVRESDGQWPWLGSFVQEDWVPDGPIRQTFPHCIKICNIQHSDGWSGHAH